MLQTYARWCTASGMRPSTIELRVSWLRCAHRDAPLDTATTDDLIAWLTSREWAPETRRAARNALRSYYEWAHESGHRADNPAATLRPIRVPTALPRPCPSDIFRQALADANDRDRLMLGLAAFAGLRCAEIAGLRWEDITGRMLRVVGKGGQTRLIPISPALADLLDEEACRSLSRWVFPGRDGAVKPDTVSHRLSRALDGKWTGHTLRHRFATMAYRTQRDLLTVQRLLGHSKPETTARYAEPPADAAIAAVLGAAA